MKRGFLTTDRAKRALEKEYPAKRRVLATPLGGATPSTTATTGVHANTPTNDGASPTVPPAVGAPEESGRNVGASSEPKAVLTGARASDADVNKRSIGIDDESATHDATRVTVAGTEKAPDADGDRDIVVAVTEDKKASEKNDDQPTADTKTEQAGNSKDTGKPAATADDKNDDGPVHINGVHYVDSNTNLHTVPSAATRPSSIVHSEKRRAVFRVWPRDPKGKVFFRYEANFMPGGKVAPNGIRSWGATLYDFYSIKPIPSEPGIIAYLSGSRIAAAMRENGEVEHCRDELEWADNEESPCEIPVAGTGELIECYEARTPLFKVYSAVEEVRVAAMAAFTKEDKDDDDDEEDEKNEDNNEEDEEDGKTGTDKAEKPHYGISSVLMPDRPLSSPFHPSHYPPPWPFIPFANPYPPVLLQERIPMHLLPETLYVHDPYSLLKVDECRDRSDDKTPWINMRPRVYLYKLSFESSMLKAVEESKKTAEESARKNKRILHTKWHYQRNHLHQPVLKRRICTSHQRRNLARVIIRSCTKPSGSCLGTCSRNPSCAKVASLRNSKRKCAS